jgi:hypothetical protein
MPSGRSELLLSLGALQQIQVLVELWALSKHPSLDNNNNNNNNNNGNTIVNRGESSSSSSSPSSTQTSPSSSSSRYDSLIVVEALKALVRMAILSKSGSRLLLNGGMTNFDPYNMMAGSIRGKGGSITRSGLSIQIIKAFESFRGKYIPTTSNNSGGKGDVDSNNNNNKKKKNGDEGLLWWDQPATAPTAIIVTETSSKEGGGGGGEKHQQQQYRIDEPAPQTTTSLIPPPAPSKDQLRRLEAWAQTQQTGASRTVILGELLHILRPVVYTLALKKWGRTSWKPYLLSLFIDLSSWQATAGGAARSAHAARHAATHPSVKGTSLELLFSLQAMQWRREDLDELTRRKLLLGYYLLRDPMFGRWTVRGLRRWERVVERVPLVGWMTGKGVEILVGAQQLYSYTCAS